MFMSETEYAGDPAGVELNAQAVLFVSGNNEYCIVGDFVENTVPFAGIPDIAGDASAAVAITNAKIKIVSIFFIFFMSPMSCLLCLGTQLNL